jgi:hypothetical protein
VATAVLGHHRQRGDDVEAAAHSRSVEGPGDAVEIDLTERRTPVHHRRNPVSDIDHHVA